MQIDKIIVGSSIDKVLQIVAKIVSVTEFLPVQKSVPVKTTMLSVQVKKMNKELL